MNEKRLIEEVIHVSRLCPQTPREMAQRLIALIREHDKVELPRQEGSLGHSMNCSELRGENEGSKGLSLEAIANQPDCTCGLYWRICLQTEQTLRAAWEKRAYQCEREREDELSAFQAECAICSAGFHRDEHSKPKERELWIWVGDRSYTQAAHGRSTHSYPTSPAFRSREDAETWKHQMMAGDYKEDFTSWLGPYHINVPLLETPRQRLVEEFAEMRAEGTVVMTADMRDRCWAELVKEE